MMEVKVMAEPVEKEKEEKEYGPYDRWEIESAARTLVEAEEIKADKEKMKYVKMCMSKKYAAEQKVMKEISSIDDIRKVAKSKQDEATEDESY